MVDLLDFDGVSMDRIVDYALGFCPKTGPIDWDDLFCRIEGARRAFAQWAFDQAWNIDYDSHFKEVARDRSPKDPERCKTMADCWSALNRMGREHKSRAVNKPDDLGGLDYWI